MEPEGTTSREWAMAQCRAQGFEPEVRYISTDLQVHLRLVEHGLAAAVLPTLADEAHHAGVTTSALGRDPARHVFSSTRSGAERRPALRAVVEALRDACAERPRPFRRAL